MASHFLTVSFSGEVYNGEDPSLALMRFIFSASFAATTVTVMSGEKIKLFFDHRSIQMHSLNITITASPKNACDQVLTIWYGID